MKIFFKTVIVAMIVGMTACQTRELNTKTSFLTGWKTFDETTTRFEAYENNVSNSPIGMLPIQGGTFTIGQMDEFITAPRNTQRRSITVSSFYMDKYEVTNMGWREYVQWMEYVFGHVNPDLARSTLPDTTVWREAMAFNDPFVENYFRHPAYSFYPVVGVSWDQAMAYCQWRTDRVNENILVTNKYMEKLPYDLINPTRTYTAEEIDNFLKNNPDHPEYAVYEKETIGDTASTGTTMYRLPYEWIRDQFAFNTEKYLYDGRYTPTYGSAKRKDAYNNPRKIQAADGILLTGYRLPTEAEWEYAAFAPIANTEEGFPIEGKIYPWSGFHPRDLSKNQKGRMAANFIRGRGDLMGVAGATNDSYVYTAPVDAYMPNDFGLYNMAGNVNEWVLDVYRETTYEDAAEYNPYRGNIYTKLQRDENGALIVTPAGAIAVEFSAEDDKRNYRDGDAGSLFDTDYPLDTIGLTDEQKENVKIDPSDVLAPHISNKSRVYKGGSWNDRIYWLNPTTRRYKNQNESSSTIGFRCAMSMHGQEKL